MKQKLGFLLVLIAIVVLVIGAMKLWSSFSPKQGVLKVNSSPTASIFLGNKHIGRTPFEDKVDIGEYTVKLTPETTTTNLSSWQGNIRVTPNLLTYVNVNLAESEFITSADTIWLEKISSRVSEMSVTTNPDGATVAIDGETKGVTPLSISSINPGDHTVIITSAGFVSRTLKIKATAGYKIIASVKLSLSSQPSQPEEATPSPIPTGGAKPTPTPKSTPKSATSSASTVPDPPRPFVRIKDTPTGFLRVRMEPSISATEAARVNPGEKYHIEDEQSSWYQIKYDGTNTGWISGAYAEKTE